MGKRRVRWSTLIILIILRIPPTLVVVFGSVFMFVIWFSAMLNWFSPLEWLFREVAAGIDWFSRAAHSLSHDDPLEQARLASTR